MNAPASSVASTAKPFSCAELLDRGDAGLDGAVAEAGRLGEDEHARLLRLSGEGDARRRQHEQRHDEETAEHRGEPGHDPDGLVWRTRCAMDDAATPEPISPASPSIGATGGKLSMPVESDSFDGVDAILDGSDSFAKRADPVDAAYFFGAAAAATGSAVKVPAASNGFTLIVPSSFFARLLGRVDDRERGALIVAAVREGDGITLHFAGDRLRRSALIVAAHAGDLRARPARSRRSC